MPGLTNTWFPNRGALMVCWAAISLMAGPGAAGAAAAWTAVAWTAAAGAVVARAVGADTALAAVATRSPAAASAAVITFLCFNARHSFCSARRHFRPAYRPLR